MDPFLGEIKMVGFSFAPSGFAFCQAQLMPISQNTALFALLGTTFGGDGVQTYGLPDYRGRVAVGMGSGPGRTPISQGEVSGTENVNLISAQMPTHNHTVVSSIAIPASANDGDSPTPSATAIMGGMTDPTGGRQPASVYLSAAATATLQPFNANATVGTAGGSIPFAILNPYLGTNFVIALNGVFPSRN